MLDRRVKWPSGYSTFNNKTSLKESLFYLFLGWFPAKFVQLLDERSKQYSSAGDDSIAECITDLVRGNLCHAIKQVLEHGMKRPYFLGK